MKAISIRQPFVTDIMTGAKTYEYRSWNTEHRGDLLICSSSAPKTPGFILGQALCIVNVTDVIKLNGKNRKQYGYEFPISRNEDVYAWKLEDVRIVKPFPVKGKLNFYYVDDEEIEILYNGIIEDDVSYKLFEEQILPLAYKYGEIGNYCYDAETPAVIRWRVGQAELEYVTEKEKKWKKTEEGSKYEVAYYEGDEDSGLEEITVGQAHKILDSWGIKKPYDE